MILGIIILSLLIICSLVAAGVWVKGLKEQRRVEDLIRNTDPIPQPAVPFDMQSQKITKIEGFRTRMRNFRNTLVGVGRPGNV